MTRWRLTIYFRLVSLRALVVIAAAGLLGCAREPQRYAPPLQRTLGGFAPAAPLRMGSFVRFSDLNASAYVVDGIQPESQGGGWRWTNERPQLRFTLDRTDGWKFSAFFGFPEATMKQTGPVTVSVLINGRLLDRVRYAKPGDRLYEKPVPRAWLSTSNFNFVTLEIQPPFIAEADQAKLGCVLHRAGFLKR